MPRQPEPSPASDTHDILCGWCGVPVKASPSTRSQGNRKYCSRACYAAARSTKEERICKHCGQAFRVLGQLVRKGLGTYCSTACRVASTGVGLRTSVPVRCAICDTERSVRPSVLARGFGRYCSRACSNIGNSRGQNDVRAPGSWVLAVCLHCGRERELARSQAARREGRYCDRGCKEAFARGEGAGKQRADGYVLARRDDGTWDLAHCVAMEHVLGRRLSREEDVRHRDGDRGNNEPGNLELVAPLAPASTRATRQRRSGWGPGYDACIRCRGTERPHCARGLCRLCYTRELRGTASHTYRTRVPAAPGDGSVSPPSP